MKVRRTSLMKRIAMLVFLGFGVLLGVAHAQKETVLYSFCPKSGCDDGWLPHAAVVFDDKGNLYGTTEAGGAGDNRGVAFKLTPKGDEIVLHSFCVQNNCTDGRNPFSGLVFDRKGNLYGTTLFGGTYTSGLVFKLTPEGKETVLYAFCPVGTCDDGGDPAGGLVLDRKGNLYGTTVDGGAGQSGVLFKLTPGGKETVLHAFCCEDGAQPWAGAVFDQKGNLYGTTYRGGNCCGVVFKLTPKGKETVLYRFCAQAGCTDGANPYAGLVLDRNGNLYRTTSGGGTYVPNCGTYEGGSHGCGVVFKLTPKGKETVLYRFCVGQVGCADGANPLAGVVFDQKGSLYGTTSAGGVGGRNGVVFKLTSLSHVH